MKKDMKANRKLQKKPWKGEFLVKVERKVCVKPKTNKKKTQKQILEMFLNEILGISEERISTKWAKNYLATIDRSQH